MKNYFITGTDTEIGKTFATCAMIHALQRRGKKVAPMKPVAAGTINVNGVDINEDVAAIMSVTGNVYAQADVNPYCFHQGIAPHLAARHEGRTIDMAVIRAAYDRLAAASDIVLVEGAGGYAVPMTDTQSMADIPVALGLEVILVVGMRLGCINHAVLTADAIRARGLKLAGWIANTPASQMTAFDENLATLKAVMQAPLLGTIPRIAASYLVSALDATAIAAKHIDVSSIV